MRFGNGDWVAALPGTVRSTAKMSPPNAGYELMTHATAGDNISWISLKKAVYKFYVLNTGHGACD